ncbi:hypothetical protein FNV43_RR25512 [Rhamnella rubrinervis]|uniref:Glycosyltransferase n=1 Tax=Rhamnella rubrinervis TaxID=2594499 RepID=A0A8K0GQ60_9ROSA|nr:hypothetical protein FNV43_RR25512 [Rhamnella rubrinervis]
MDDSTKRSGVRVLMLPWLAHGHITPFLELAKKLADRNFHIYFCSAPVNLISLKPKLSDSKYSNSIQLVELHLPSFPELPPQYHTTKGLPPHLMPVLEKASNMSRPNVTNIIETLKPDLVMYDYHARWVPEVASSLNIAAVSFMTSGVAGISFFHYYYTSKRDADDEFPFPELLADYMRNKFSQIKIAVASSNSNKRNEKGTSYEVSDQSHSSSKIMFVKTFREIEGKYMDYYFHSSGVKIVPVGPLVSDQSVQEDEGKEIIDWLDDKDESSTVFVSFGSECYLSKEGMEEIAHGLELSNVNFIWVVRFPEGEKMKLEKALPDGFLEKVRGRGLVVENWAPQVKILKHSSIGGFVSHCGWNSVMESMKFGVPIIAIPIQYDQPWNARVVVSSGVGLEVKRDVHNWKFGRENVAKVIKQVVVEKIGDDVRRKAKEMSDNIKTKAEEEMDEVEKEILHVCGIL